MEHLDDLVGASSLTNVQIHEIKPSSGVTSFAALLEKFFLNMEEEKKGTQKKIDDSFVPAQNLVAGKEQ